MNRKMIFFDIDGTILAEDAKIIPNSTRRAICLAKENGHLVFINTGRTYASIPKEIKEMEFDGYVCGCGTHIFFRGQELLSKTFSHERCIELAGTLEQFELLGFFEAKEAVYFHSSLLETVPELGGMKAEFESVGLEFPKDWEKGTLTFDKFLVFLTEKSNLEGFLKFIEKDCTYIDRGNHIAEVIMKGYSKATGIAFLCDTLSVSLEDCYAIGDSTNDLEMLRFVPNSIAMGNAMEEILPYCAYQTTDLMEDGIYRAMEHCGLIGEDLKEQEKEQPEITVIGAAVLDVLVRPAGAQVFETGSYPAEEIHIYTGGDALNEATVLARLGKTVHLNSIIGKDREGQMVLDHCNMNGILTDAVIEKEQLQTGVNVVLIDECQERHFLTNQNGSLRKLTIEDICIPDKTKILSFASIFVFPELKTTEMVRLFQEAKERKMILCADMTKCKHGETVADIKEALGYLDYLFANEEEAAMITGELISEKMADILLSCDVKCVIIKKGNKGCLIKTKDTELHIPAFLGGRCVDTTGAGDSFAAGFIAKLAEGKSLHECGVYANACGALAIEKVGATGAIENSEQVEQLISGTDR